MEVVLILKSLVQFLVWLSEGDVEHGNEGLLDSLGSIEECFREILGGQGCKDGWEESCIELTDVRD